MSFSRTHKAVKANSFVLVTLLLAAESPLAEQFSIVVLPDTQYYAVNNPGIFDAQTNWIVTNRAAENIIYVAHMGDIVDGTGCNSGPTEWTNVSNSMAALEGAPAVPYGVMPGNHDFDPNPATTVCSGNRVQYNATFGQSRFTGTTFYGGVPPLATTNDNNYTLFSSAEVDFIAINLAYSFTSGPTEAALIAWADGLLVANPNRVGIVTSHFLLSDGFGGANCPAGADFGDYGAALWTALSDNPNLAFMLSGHCPGERWISFAGGSTDRPGCLGDVHGLMANYQDYNNLANPGTNDSGYMRIMRFDTVLRTIDVETFSPTIAGGGAAVTITNPTSMNNNSLSNFSLDYNAFVPPTSCSDVVLTMDRSGSMNGASAVTGTKLDALKAAADLFVDQMALDRVHRLAMTQFSSAPVPFSVPEIAFGRLDSDNVGEAHAMIGSLIGGGATNIIAGLDDGANKLNVGAPNPRRVAVLFTDGKHNTPSTLGDGPLQAALQGELDDVSTSLELYSLGFGTSISSAALSSTANANGGWHVDEVDSLSVAKDFSLVAASVMDDSTLSDPVYVIKPSETRTHDVAVSSADRNLTFVTHWDVFDPSRVRTSIVPPGGEDCPIVSDAIVSGTQQTGGRNYRLARVNLPYSCNGTRLHEGEWQVQMTVSDRPRAAERVDILVYSETEIRLNSRVDLAGGRLSIQAFLGGAPLKDATFTAFILPPLPETRDSTRLDELGSTPGGADSIPPLTLISRTPIAVPLTVNGRTADSIEAVGVYNPIKRGNYQVRVVANLIDGSGQSVNRESIASFYSPKARSSFGIKWITILVVFVALLIVFVIFRGIARKSKV